MMKKLYSNFPILLIISAMGPYISLSLGLKVDNLVIYPLMFLALLLILSKKVIKINKSVLGIFILWTFSTVYMIVRTLIFGGEISTYSLIAEINNFAQPLSIIFLFMFILVHKEKLEIEDTIRKSGKVLLFLLCINTLWIFFGFFVNVNFINEYFWGGAKSVAANAVQNGRFSGIFNQPIEAGVAYTMGLFLWLYLIEKEHIKINLITISCLLLLFVGGAVTVSKVFVIMGIAMFILGALTVKRVRRRLIPLAIGFLILGYPIYKYLSTSWFGFDYLFRFLDISNYQTQGLLMLMTAGRYGSADSQQNSYFERIWVSSPIVGEGLGSQMTYDSAYFHFFSSGGLISLTAYLLLMLVIGWLVFETYCIGNKSETKLFIGLFILVVAGGLGAPILTINRSSIILWVFIGLLLQYLCALKTQKKKKRISQLEQTVR